MGSDRRKQERRLKSKRVLRERRRKERRKTNRRHHLRYVVDFWLQERMRAETTSRHTGNLSTGGLYIDSGVPRNPGTRSRVLFTLPSDEYLIDAIVEVTDYHIHPNDMGTHLRFVEISTDDKQRIQNFLNRQ